jgi:hypothetical protein
MRGSRTRAVVFVAAASVLLGTGLIAPPADAANGRAGVVVVHGDGTVRTDCVALTKAEISGFRLLKESDFEFRAARFSFGRAVCWLDGEGVDTRDPDSCLPSSGPTWGYFTQEKGGTPAESQVGPDDRRVTRGDVDYYVFGTFPQTTPQKLTVRQICA